MKDAVVEVLDSAATGIVLFKLLSGATTTAYAHMKTIGAAHDAPSRRRHPDVVVRVAVLR
jgi:hypothetical protein